MYTGGLKYVEVAALSVFEVLAALPRKAPFSVKTLYISYADKCTLFYVI